MDTATKTGIDASKTASKRVVQKTAEASMHDQICVILVMRLLLWKEKLLLQEEVIVAEK